ncbi:MAG: TadE family protein [Brooklawnia sp.]
MDPRSSGDRGSASLELVIWGPVLLLIVSVIIYAGRVAQAGLTVESAAGEAARAATVADNRAQANTRAEAAASAALSSAGLKCASVSVSVDTSEWNRPAGQPARAEATVSCRVALGDLIGPGLIPGSRVVSSTATSALDTFRTRP